MAWLHPLARLREHALGVLFLVLVFLLAGSGANGGGWMVVASDLDEALLSIGGTSSSDVYAVGADKGAGPIVLHFDGESWARLETGSQGDLWWVHAFKSGPIFMGGSASTILRYERGAFTRMVTPGLATHTIYGIWGASPTDLYAVGSVSGRNGFIWHYEGAELRDVTLPSGIVQDPDGDIPGFSKVWGNSRWDVYVVGGMGVLLRSVGGAPFEVVASGTIEPLFTVYGSDDVTVTVGGSDEGTVLEAGTDGAFATRTPAGAPLLQGISLDARGRGYASGAGGAVFQRRYGQWESVEHGLPLDVASLHAVWIDPDGGMWSAGGNVLASSLDNGALIHFGKRVPVYDPKARVDAGVDMGPPRVVCPANQIDPHPTGSIARRWNEQILGAIRRSIPRPGVHARNLFHTSVAMYDAWAAYDDTADGYVFREKLTAADVAAARDQAISYAAYRVLAHRYQMENGGPVSVACFRAFLGVLGLDPDDEHATGDDPVAVGNRVGAAVIQSNSDDGANEANNYADTTGFTAANPPLEVDSPWAAVTNPQFWQPLNLTVAVTQNGIPTLGGAQGYVGAQWGLVRPFALTRPGVGMPYFDVGPGPLFDDAVVPHIVEVIRRSSEMDATSPSTIDISPSAYGNNPVGSNSGTGRATNPVTGLPYPPQVVPLGDFGRVLAEFWADGPQSETPPGHWNAIANYVADHPLFTRRFGGAGPVIDPLEWDVKVYFTINAAVHDAGIAAWEVKRLYTTARPITLIRYVGSRGQGTDPGMPNYDARGLPLTPGLIELITSESSAPGARHAHLARYVGQLAIKAWRGEPGDRRHEVGGVGWIRAVEWTPYQRRTFVTPAFPGYVSGHSTFSRSAAEVMAALTGSDFFPGGLGEHVAAPNTFLLNERGPTVEVRLQWATYFDAADQAGQSRLWGGIHIEPDDFMGRLVGSQIGPRVVSLAQTYFIGTAVP